jgi:uncharacterized protein YecT (DUF1311 family)
MNRIVVTALLLFVWKSAPAQSKQNPCWKTAMAQPEMNRCADEDASAADVELNRM